MAVSWYNLYFDGARIAEGPTRFIGAQPYYDTTVVMIPTPGEHVISIHAHSCGEQTRILLKNDPVVWCAVTSSDHPISALRWRCAVLRSYRSQWQRMSTLLGWMENATVDAAFVSWTTLAFDDSAWVAPFTATKPVLNMPIPLAGVNGAATSMAGACALVAHGMLWERFGYEDDEPAARFILRSLQPATAAQDLVLSCGANVHAAAAAAAAAASALPDGLDFGPAQGLWWRFDAARAQLLRPVLVVSAPAGTVFEICYCQALVDGKASV